MLRRLAALALALALVASSGCQATRLYAKDLLYHKSAAVRVPSWIATFLFVGPPTLAWLPISAPVVAIAQDEGAIWFALAPGIIVGTPFLFLFGTPPYLIVGKDAPPADDAERPKPR